MYAALCITSGKNYEDNFFKNNDKYIKHYFLTELRKTGFVFFFLKRKCPLIH